MDILNDMGVSKSECIKKSLVKIFLNSHTNKLFILFTIYVCMFIKVQSPVVRLLWLHSVHACADCGPFSKVRLH